MKKNPWIALLLLCSFGFVLLGLISCVTVNVNIPDSAVQQATDDYVKDLYEAKAKSTKPSPSPSPTPSVIHKAQYEIISTAYAEEPTVSTQSPKAQDISDRLRARLPQITQLKSEGILGESNEGKLTIQGKVKKSDEKRVWGLVQNENGDRFELYHEIVAHNGLNKGNLETIARNFAHSFQKHSPAGTWVQDDAGTWSQKQ
jgi:uncharacterized protein YdbL (DUF1318 family)